MDFDMRIQSSLASQPLNEVVDFRQLNKINEIADVRQKAEATAGQMESIFMDMMVKAMRKTVPEGGLLGKGRGGENYVDMLDQQMAGMSDLMTHSDFHESLVRQIMDGPQAASQAMTNMAQGQASEPVEGLDMPGVSDRKQDV